MNNESHQPIMTIQERMALMKKEKQNVSLLENTNIVDVDNIEVVNPSKNNEDKPAKKRLSKNDKVEFKNYLIDSFSPKHFDMERLPKTVKIRKDVSKKEARLLNLVGGAGARFKTIDENGNVVRVMMSLSAFYNFLLERFFDEYKAEIEALEKKQKLLNN